METICGEFHVIERGIHDYLNRTTPDLSLCFQQTVLVWIPTAYILLGCIPYMYALKKRVKFYIPHTWLNLMKMCCGVLIACGAVAELGLRLADYAERKPVWAHQLLAPGFIFLSTIVSVILVEFERRKSVRTSMFLAGFWILCTTTYIIRIRSAIIRSWYKTLAADFVLTCLCCCLSVASMILSFLVDRKPVFFTAKEQHGNPSPSSSASVLSRLFFCWPAKTIWRGFRHSLDMSNMWDLQGSYTCQQSHDKLYAKWKEELKIAKRQSVTNIEIQPAERAPLTDHTTRLDVNADTAASPRQPSLFRAIMKAFWPQYVCGVILQIIHTLIIICIPQIFRKLIQFSEDPSLPVYNGVVYAVILLATSIVKCLVFQQMIIIQDKQGQSISTAMTAMVYTKSLRLTPAAREQSTTGEIVNLMSSDCHGYFELMTYFRTAISFPLHILLTIAFLWQLLGPSALVGLAILLLIIPINILIARLRKQIEVKRKKLKDSRIKETHEVLNGIKMIKLHAWETSFENKIRDLRREEVKMIKYSAYLMTLSDAIHSLLPFMVALCTFAVYVMSDDGHVLTTEIAFVSLAYFQVVQQPLVLMSRVVRELVHSNVAHSRLFTFLLRDEIDPETVLHTGLKEYDIVIRHGSFSWRQCEQPVLKNIELLVPRGTITAIVGNIGSGKSSLLSALLGEMVVNSGTVNIKGSVAYVAQQPWIQQASVKENILFDQEYNQVIYDAVIRECDLLTDLDVLPAGDLTQIGEKGINLSGGQKLRVSLARAVYQNQDVYLLDDPLSAVDANVGRSIFDRVIGPEGMLKNKTRILVTHSMWMLSQVDQIVVLQNGEVCEAGTYASLMDKRSIFYRLYSASDHQDTTEPSATPDAQMSTDVTKRDKSRTKITDALHQNWTSTSHTDEDHLVVTSLPDGLNSETTHVPGTDSGRPRSMMFVRTLAMDRAAKADETDNNSSQSWLRTKQKLRRRLSSIENRLAKVYKEDREFSSHYFVSEADMRREDEMLLPDDPAPEHVDLEEAEDRLLLQDGGQAKGDEPGDRLDKSTEDGKKKKGLLINEEELEKGRVKMSVYATYLRAVGLLPCLCVLLLCVISRAMDITSGMWLARWSDHLSTESGTKTQDIALVDNSSYDGIIPTLYNTSTSSDTYSDTSSDTYIDTAPFEDRRSYYISGYAIIGIIQILISTLWICVSTIACLRTGVVHHSSLLHSMLAAPMSFYDTTPTGRILNRFGGDMLALDIRLPAEFRNLMKFMIGALGCVVVVTVVTPWSLLAWFILGAVYSFVQMVFVPNLRQVRRLVSANHSPIFSQFTETLHGVTTIRAFARQDAFIQRFHGRVNVLLKILYVGYHFNRLLSVVIECVGATAVFVAALLAVLARDSLSTGLLALSITYVGQITHYLNWLVRLTSACESDIVSVERIKEYIDIPPEGTHIRPTTTPENEWPRRGAIEFKDYCTRYRPELDLILNGVSCSIFPGEKVGLVGRTGAGKTSLTLALFRMIEAASGSITIDGVDIAEISLYQLRKRLTIIPQDPVLFAGTLRFNLDPCGVHNDTDLWQVLRLAHLADTVTALSGKLDFKCCEGCSNLSVGERQLVCLARALLKKSPILILDEATASCDTETDHLIQKTIRTEFASCTVITVAHRLNTVRDYDRIMVLDNGVVREMDTPERLMDDPTTIFHTMAKNAGLISSAFHRY